MYSETDISNMRELAVVYGLVGADIFYRASIKELREICNGVGTERWSLRKRKSLTEAFKPYELAIAIDDFLRRHTESTAKEANKRLKKNLKKLWAIQYGKSRWLSRKALTERFVILPKLYTIVISEASK